MIPLALLWLLQFQQAQPKQTSLAAFMAAHPWDAAKKGPLVVVNAEHKFAKADAVSLDAFDRKLVNIGGISAYVPRTMVVIDDSMTQTPNMYEGLPADAKVLYLLRSLTEDQWKTLNDSGIGLGDLQGEQRLVFQSLLPKPFAWSSYTVDSDGMAGKQQGGATLSDDELPSVRLKVQRYVAMQVFLNGGNSYSETSTAQFRGAPGSVLYARDYDQKRVESVFAVKLRSVVDNQSKPSDLDYAELRTKVGVSSPATVRDLLRLVGSATHRELIADVHIADLPVTTIGSEATAGDLLKAVAECVTGTFRRVGSAYVLTSDIVGIGNRKLRLATWESQLQQKVFENSTKWRHEIAATSGFKNLSFGGGDTMTPSKDLKSTIDKGDESMPVQVTADKLGGGLSKILDLWDHEYPSQPISKDKVGLSSDINYSFVLADGTQLQPEIQALGSRSQFVAIYGERSPQTPANLPVALPKDIPFQLAVHGNGAGFLNSLFEHCVAHGVKKIWLESTDPATVSLAVAKGAKSNIEVGLLIRPWQLPQGAEPDRTLFGDHGVAVSEHLSQSVSWNSWLSGQGIGLRTFSDMMTPSDPAVEDRWKSLAALAQTPGLVGVTIAETQPPGYEAKRESFRSTLGPLEWAMVGHGYSERQRLEFLRKNEIDPIDLFDQEIRTTADIDQPFFSSPQGQSGRLDNLSYGWRTFLAAKNNKSVLQLAAAIGRPMWIEVRPLLVNTMPSGYGMFSAWHAGEELPVGKGQQTAMFNPGTRGMIFIPMPVETSSPLGVNRSQLLSSMSRRPGGEAIKIDMIFDFTQNPGEEVGAALDRWFTLPKR